MLEVELLAISSEDCGLCHSWWWWWRGVGVGEKWEVRFKCKHKNSTHVNRRKVRARVGVRRRIPVAQTLPVRPKTVWNGFCVTCICGMIMWCFVLFVVLIYLGGGGGGGGGGVEGDWIWRLVDGFDCMVVSTAVDSCNYRTVNCSSTSRKVCAWLLTQKEHSHVGLHITRADVEILVRRLDYYQYLGSAG